MSHQIAPIILNYKIETRTQKTQAKEYANKDTENSDQRILY